MNYPVPGPVQGDPAGPAAGWAAEGQLQAGGGGGGHHDTIPNHALLDNLADDPIAYSSMWLNFRPFPSVWLNFTSHRVLK